MRVILAAFQLQVSAVEVSTGTHIANDDIIDAGVRLPVWRANPYVRRVANFLKDSLDVAVTLVEVVYEKLIAAETDNDVCWLHFPHEVLQGICLCPLL